MTRGVHGIILALVMAIALTIPATARAQADTPPDATRSVAGHYYLQGVMETGSELLLDAQGRFRWYLVYGALDLFAEGTWRQEDGRVLLVSEKTADVPEPGFETLALTIRDADLVPPDGRGAYVRRRDREQEPSEPPSNVPSED